MCHSNPDVIASIVVRAQDRGMMEGDYAWFLLNDFPTDALLKPWTATLVYNKTDLNRRLEALYALNLVHVLSCHAIQQPIYAHYG